MTWRGEIPDKRSVIAGAKAFLEPFAIGACNIAIKRGLHLPHLALRGQVDIQHQQPVEDRWRDADDIIGGENPDDGVAGQRQLQIFVAKRAGVFRLEQRMQRCQRVGLAPDVESLVQFIKHNDGRCRLGIWTGHSRS